MSNQRKLPRFILWIDAVGGYLVCPYPMVRIGQAVTDNCMDVPVLGDLARHHLKISRDNGCYLLDPIAYTEVNEREIRETTLLRDGDLLGLTGNIRFRFRLPHPLSASARLEFESPHRTQPWTDGVLLMAESCVLGPNRRNHVICPGWAEDIVLFRKNDQLFCKSFREISVDGCLFQGQAPINDNSRIEGEDFSMTLEPLSS